MEQLHEQIEVLRAQWEAIYTDPASAGAAQGHLSDISFEQLNEVVGIVCIWLDRRRAPTGFAPTFHVAKALAATALAGAISAARNIRAGQPAHYPSFVSALNQTLSALHSIFVYSDKADSISSDLTGKLNEALTLLQTAQKELTEKLALLESSDERAEHIGTLAENVSAKSRSADVSANAIEKLLENAKVRVLELDKDEDAVAEFRDDAEKLQLEQAKIVADLKAAEKQLASLMEATKKQSMR